MQSPHNIPRLWRQHTLRRQSKCPVFNIPYNSCDKLGHFSKVCHSKYSLSEPKSVATTSTNKLSACRNPFISNISYVAAIDPAPKISINITSFNGSASVSALPDSGDDIPAARKAMLHHLNEYVDNLLPSNTIPKVANGTEMHLMGKLPGHCDSG